MQDVAINSPQSQNDAVGATLDRYATATMPNRAAKMMMRILRSFIWRASGRTKGSRIQGIKGSNAEHPSRQYHSVGQSRELML
jgi:hypothetical protein